MTFVVMLNLTRDMTAYGRFSCFAISLGIIALLFFFLIREPKFKEKEEDFILNGKKISWLEKTKLITI